MKLHVRFCPRTGFYEELWSEMPRIKGWVRVK
jgi:hypothetical protein